MPWVSHDRVTVDYLPDHGLLGGVHAKRGRVKRMATWYRSMLASRRNSDNADLLLGGGRRRRRRRRERDLDVSLGAALAELGSPFAATKRRKGRTERSRRHHHSHHHHSRHSRRHHHHRPSDDNEDDHSSAGSSTPFTPMYPYFPPHFPIAFQSPAFAQPDGPTTAAAYQPLLSPGAAAPFYVFQPATMPHEPNTKQPAHTHAPS
jgi:hypothetical protein